MRRNPLRPALLAVAFAAGLIAAVAAPRTASAGWWDEAVKAREATLDELRAAPERWLDVPASLVLRFVRAEGAATTSGAYDEWRAFTATAGTAPSPAAKSKTAPAQVSAQANSKNAVPFVHFLVRGGSAEDARLAALREGDEIRVRAIVRNAGPGADRTFGTAASTVGEGVPVIEVVWISGAADALSPEELATLARADDLMRRDNAPGAETMVRALLAGRELAPPIRADLWRRIARACRDQRRLGNAADAYRNALQIEPDDRVSRADLAMIDEALRRTVTASAAPPADTSGRAARTAPTPPAVDIPVPAVALRLAGPKDDAPPSRTAAPVASPAVASPAAKAAAAPPAAPAAEPPAPPSRLAPPK